MRMHRLISGGFMIAALASASVPALASTVWPDVDFEWYADVGKPLAPSRVEVVLAPRQGYIVAPGHWENRAGRQVFIEAHYVAEDYPRQVAVYNNPNGTTTYATGPLLLRDRDGNIIPTQPELYPVGSATR